PLVTRGREERAHQERDDCRMLHGFILSRPLGPGHSQTPRTGPRRLDAPSVWHPRSRDEGCCRPSAHGPARRGARTTSEVANAAGRHTVPELGVRCRVRSVAVPRPLAVLVPVALAAVPVFRAGLPSLLVSTLL